VAPVAGGDPESCPFHFTFHAFLAMFSSFSTTGKPMRMTKYETRDELRGVRILDMERSAQDQDSTG